MFTTKHDLILFTVYISNCNLLTNESFDIAKVVEVFTGLARSFQYDQTVKQLTVLKDRVSFQNT